MLGKGSEIPLTTAKINTKPVPIVLHIQTVETGVLRLVVFCFRLDCLFFFSPLDIFSSQHDLKDWPCFKQINWYYQSVTSLAWLICTQGHLHLMAVVKLKLVILPSGEPTQSAAVP